jgi:DNA (cytosine-5)-methyltransferase 1
MEKAGFTSTLLNEIDPAACDTLRSNRPEWNVIEGDITKLSFTQYRGEVDVISGGFPCQSFSCAGKKLGFEDIRGLLFFEFARALQEARPTVFIAENVTGLVSHDNGRTLETILDVVHELGYVLVPPRVLRAMFFQVPQKRERLFLVGIRRDLANVVFKWPSPYPHILTVRDALMAGDLYPCDAPPSPGTAYPARKAEIMAQVPEGGYWRDLPDNLQREYMGASYFQGGGKTGVARRLSWDEPSLTLTCSPDQKQTTRCHPADTRPLTVREYARIQTFPDSWTFSGSLTSQYKQIGNAVPVNLAYAVGRSLVRLLNDIEVSKTGS